MSVADRAQAVHRRHRARPVPAEGENDLYTQSWYPICLSSDLKSAGVVGAEFLGGRVVAFRGAGGKAYVLSAYCVHVGADLSVGRVVGERIRCAFHGWEYDSAGVCRTTGSGDPVPPSARVYRFPTAERYGIVWAFNGDEPLFEIPHTEHDESSLSMRWNRFGELAMEPWMVSAHTMDLQHLSMPHGFTLDSDPADSVTWTDMSIGYELHGTLPRGNRYDVRIDIHGPNLFLQTGHIDDRWYFWLTSPTLPGPGHTNAYFVFGIKPRADESAEEVDAALDSILASQMQFYADDSEIFDNIVFTPGLLTKSDATLARFLEFMRHYPRAHPAREFVN